MWLVLAASGYYNSFKSFPFQLQLQRKTRARQTLTSLLIFNLRMSKSVNFRPNLFNKYDVSSLVRYTKRPNPQYLSEQNFIN